MLLSAGADRAQSKTVADTKRPIAIPTEQEAVAPEAFPNPSEVRNFILSCWHQCLLPGQACVRLRILSGF